MAGFSLSAARMQRARIAPLALAIGLSSVAAPLVQAADADAPLTQHYQVPAGDLAGALTGFARQAGATHLSVSRSEEEPARPASAYSLMPRNWPICGRHSLPASTALPQVLPSYSVAPACRPSSRGRVCISLFRPIAPLTAPCLGYCWSRVNG